MEVTLDRQAEWKQIFNECWRQMRDFFYDPNMHGVDWPVMKQRYAALLPYVNHRADLTYIIGEMIGELNVGHAYVGGGDYPRAARVQMGLLGARLERDPDTGTFQIKKILKGQNWEGGLRSPLTEIGVNVKEGDYIVAVDGKPTNEMNDIYEALVNTAGKQVTLTLNGSPKSQEAGRPWWSPRTTSARSTTTTGSRGTSRRCRRPPAARSATCTSPTWVWADSTSS